jgi:hypothetical protein
MKNNHRAKINYFCKKQKLSYYYVNHEKIYEEIAQETGVVSRNLEIFVKKHSLDSHNMNFFF